MTDASAGLFTTLESSEALFNKLIQNLEELRKQLSGSTTEKNIETLILRIQTIQNSRSFSASQIDYLALNLNDLRNNIATIAFPDSEIQEVLQQISEFEAEISKVLRFSAENKFVLSEDLKATFKEIIVEENAKFIHAAVDAAGIYDAKIRNDVVAELLTEDELVAIYEQVSIVDANGVESADFEKFKEMYLVSIQAKYEDSGSFILELEKSKGDIVELVTKADQWVRNDVQSTQLNEIEISMKSLRDSMSELLKEGGILNLILDKFSSLLRNHTTANLRGINSKLIEATKNIQEKKAFTVSELKDLLEAIKPILKLFADLPEIKSEATGKVVFGVVVEDSQNIISARKLQTEIKGLVSKFNKTHDLAFEVSDKDTVFISQIKEGIKDEDVKNLVDELLQIESDKPMPKFSELVMEYGDADIERKVELLEQIRSILARYSNERSIDITSYESAWDEVFRAMRLKIQQKFDKESFELDIAVTFQQIKAKKRAEFDLKELKIRENDLELRKEKALGKRDSIVSIFIARVERFLQELDSNRLEQMQDTPLLPEFSIVEVARRMQSYEEFLDKYRSVFELKTSDLEAQYLISILRLTNIRIRELAGLQMKPDFATTNIDELLQRYNVFKKSLINLIELKQAQQLVGSVIVNEGNLNIQQDAILDDTVVKLAGDDQVVDVQVPEEVQIVTDQEISQIINSLDIAELQKQRRLLVMVDPITGGDFVINEEPIACAAIMGSDLELMRLKKTDGAFTVTTDGVTDNVESKLNGTKGSYALNVGDVVSYSEQSYLIVKNAQGDFEMLWLPQNNIEQLKSIIQDQTRRDLLVQELKKIYSNLPPPTT